MSELPIRRLMVSDFRRIEGTRELPFDAPVVLIHGPNGTGKTSVLSALELALTGGIRSMERQSDRYRAHLPFLGQSYATVRADVAEYLQAGTTGAPLTVGGARLEGAPALTDAAAKFYAERCYLDQGSLGRLLDLYQSREGNEQTALEKFVNELLGLEKLDALRDGLKDATDLRYVKKLAIGVDEASREAKAATTEFKDQSAQLTEARKDVVVARTATYDAVDGLLSEIPTDLTDMDLAAFVQSATRANQSGTEIEAASTLYQELIALGGRISALVERPTLQRIQETRNALSAATADKEMWEATAESNVLAWEAAAQAAEADLGSEPRTAIERAISRVFQEMEGAAKLRAQAESVRIQLTVDRAQLDVLHTELADAHEHSSALVEGLTALRTVLDNGNKCPVCDRDFAETGHRSLLSHIDTKLGELTAHGNRLVDLRSERDQVAARVTRAEVENVQLTARLLTVDQQRALSQRHATLTELSAQVDDVVAAKSTGVELFRRERDLRQSLEDLEAASSEESYISNELARYANLLQVNEPLAFGSFQAIASELLGVAKDRVDRLGEKANKYRRASDQVARFTAALKRESVVIQRLADTAEKKKHWDDRFTEAKRRQQVAKEVYEAATQARATIVHRVFTESLNEVWKSVFTRLAPNEGFIPSFGIPAVTKKTFDIKLETTHRSGEASGPPQMMLSAGNLNTAALSLFLALHLVVEPIVPCLVFDDPVQAMDEVHVAQFAGLIRLLSKQNGRQVIIAVHERELFDYLTLELSPAYEGDELITIELGEHTASEDEGITRHLWTPDPALVK